MNNVTSLPNWRKRTFSKSRWEAKQNTCPKCFAPPGVSCSRPNGTERVAVHKQRFLHVSSAVAVKLMMEPASEFYFSEEWRRVRYLALRKNGGCCQLCGARGTPSVPIHVDHIKPRSKYPMLALSVENLQVLCADCNVGKSNLDETDWRP